MTEKVVPAERRAGRRHHRAATRHRRQSMGILTSLAAVTFFAGLVATASEYPWSGRLWQAHLGSDVLVVAYFLGLVAAGWWRHQRLAGMTHRTIWQRLDALSSRWAMMGDELLKKARAAARQSLFEARLRIAQEREGLRIEPFRRRLPARSGGRPSR